MADDVFNPFVDEEDEVSLNDLRSSSIEQAEETTPLPELPPLDSSSYSPAAGEGPDAGLPAPELSSGEPSLPLPPLAEEPTIVEKPPIEDLDSYFSQLVAVEDTQKPETEKDSEDSEELLDWTFGDKEVSPEGDSTSSIESATGASSDEGTFGEENASVPSSSGADDWTFGDEVVSSGISPVVDGWDFGEESANEPTITPEEDEEWSFGDETAGTSPISENVWGFEDSPKTPSETDQDWGFNDGDTDSESTVVEPDEEFSFADGETSSQANDDWGFDGEEDLNSGPNPALAVDDDWGFDDAAENRSPMGSNEETWENFGSQEDPHEPAYELTESHDEDEFFSQLTSEEDEEGNDSELTGLPLDHMPPPVRKKVKEEPEEESGLENYLNSLGAAEEEAAVPAWKRKVRDTWKQIKSELKGEDEETEQNEDPDSENEEQGNGGPNFLAKILFPYVWLAGWATKLLLLIATPLKFIPGLAKFIAPNKVFKVLGYIIPLLLVLLVLQWQGNKPLPAPPKLSFPDGGAATMSDFKYNEDPNTVSITITNRGDVIAKVTPTVEVHSIQRTFNPLSFFFAKPNEPCVGEEVRVPIDGEKTVEFACPIEGSPKKFTGRLTW